MYHSYNVIEELFHLGVGWKSKSQHYPVVIAVTKVPELLFVERTATGVWLGASTTLTTLKEVLQELVSSEPGIKRLTSLRVDDHYSSYSY